MSDQVFALTFPPELVDAIATAVAAKLAGTGSGTSPSLMTVEEAAQYLRAGRQRVYDLIHSGALVPERDGRRVLLRREAIDVYLRGGEDHDGR